MRGFSAQSVFVSPEAAYSFDASMRHETRLGEEGGPAFERLRLLSRPFEYHFEEFPSLPSMPMRCFGLFRRLRLRSYADGAEEAGAARCHALLRVMAAARKSVRGGGGGAARPCLCRRFRKIAQASAPTFISVSMYGVESVEERLWPTVVMCDMDNVSVSPFAKRTMRHGFADELGIARPRQALSDLRRAFSQAAAALGAS